MGRHILALDQGTTSTRAIVFDEEGRIAGTAQRELQQIEPAELRSRLELPAGHLDVNPERLNKCLRSLAEPFGSDARRRASLQVRRIGADSLRVELQRGWREIREISEKRQAVAKVVNQVEAELSWPFELESPQGCKLH